MNRGIQRAVEKILLHLLHLHHHPIHHHQHHIPLPQPKPPILTQKPKKEKSLTQTYVKFELLMYNAEVNAENLNNWIRQFGGLLQNSEPS